MEDLENQYKDFSSYKMGGRIGEKTKMVVFLLFKYIIVVGIIQTMSNIYLMMRGFVEGFSKNPYKLKQQTKENK